MQRDIVILVAYQKRDVRILFVSHRVKVILNSNKLIRFQLKNVDPCQVGVLSLTQRYQSFQTRYKTEIVLRFLTYECLSYRTCISSVKCPNVTCEQVKIKCTCCHIGRYSVDAVWFLSRQPLIHIVFSLIHKCSYNIVFFALRLVCVYSTKLIMFLKLNLVRYIIYTKVLCYQCIVRRPTYYCNISRFVLNHGRTTHGSLKKINL